MSSTNTPLPALTDQYDHLFKFLLIGDSNVGKTSIILRFTAGEFRESLRNTVGVDVKVKLVQCGKKRLKLTIWDTAGQERFRTLTSAYYRGAQGIILVYDITDRSSFENLSHWLSEVDLYSTNDSAVKLLIGNKSDQFDHRTVTKSEANEFAQQHGMIYIEASAKTQEGINQAFDELIQQILDVPELVAEGSGSSGGNNSSKSNGGYGGSGGSSVNMSNAFDEDRQTSRGPCGGFCPA